MFSIVLKRFSLSFHFSTQISFSFVFTFWNWKIFLLGWGKLPITWRFPIQFGGFSERQTAVQAGIAAKRGVIGWDCIDWVKQVRLHSYNDTFGLKNLSLLAQIMHQALYVVRNNFMINWVWFSLHLLVHTYKNYSFIELWCLGNWGYQEKCESMCCTGFMFMSWMIIFLMSSLFNCFYFFIFFFTLNWWKVGQDQPIEFFFSCKNPPFFSSIPIFLWVLKGTQCLPTNVITHVLKRVQSSFNHEIQELDFQKCSLCITHVMKILSFYTCLCFESSKGKRIRKTGIKNIDEIPLRRNNNFWR